MIEVHHLRQEYDKTIALENLHLQIPQGEVYGLIGPNGAGKTTFFNVIAGLYRPSAGVITLAGRDITGRKPHEIARLGIARTFQSIRVFSNMTSLENVLIGMHSHLTADPVRIIAGTL